MVEVAQSVLGLVILRVVAVDGYLKYDYECDGAEVEVEADKKAFCALSAMMIYALAINETKTNEMKNFLYLHIPLKIYRTRQCGGYNPKLTQLKIIIR